LEEWCACAAGESIYIRQGVRAVSDPIFSPEPRSVADMITEFFTWLVLVLLNFIYSLLGVERFPSG